MATIIGIAKLRQFGTVRLMDGALTASDNQLMSAYALTRGEWACLSWHLKCYQTQFNNTQVA